MNNYTKKNIKGMSKPKELLIKQFNWLIYSLMNCRVISRGYSKELKSKMRQRIIISVQIIKIIIVSYTTLTPVSHNLDSTLQSQIPSIIIITSTPNQSLNPP